MCPFSDRKQPRVRPDKSPKKPQTTIYMSARERALEITMALFQKPFFKSNSSNVEEEYITGVIHLQRGDMNAASRHLVKAAEGGHISAY